MTPIRLRYFTVLLMAVFMSPTTIFASTTITVDRAVHVTTAEGSDLVLDVGDYVVESAEEWIRITPSNGKAVDAHLLEAHTGKHEESLTDPLAISATGIEPDSHHLVLLLPDGKSFEATGSYSGIRSRGRLSRLSIQRLRELAASRRSTRRTEFETPLFGGSGGNRTYNLDCGNRSVMVGIIYKGRTWIDALGTICQRVDPSSGNLGEEFTRRAVGGSGGDARHLRCPEGRVVGGFLTVSGQFVNKIIIHCPRWDASNKKPHGYNVNAAIVGTHRFGTKTDLGIFPSTSDVFMCPNGKVGKALRGKYGRYIDSTRFVCDNWDK